MSLPLIAHQGQRAPVVSGCHAAGWCAEPHTEAAVNPIHTSQPIVIPVRGNGYIDTTRITAVAGDDDLDPLISIEVRSAFSGDYSTALTGSVADMEALAAAIQLKVSLLKQGGIR
jgi:hypothetical protein